MHKNMWQSIVFLVVMTLIVGVTSGCGINQQLKDDTSAVVGENGVLDDKCTRRVGVAETVKRNESEDASCTR